MGQVLAVVSGKGGTGKTSLCAAVACRLAELGQKVLCIDADAGLRNLDISLGMSQEAALPFTSVMDGTYPLSKASHHPKFETLCFLTAPVLKQPEDIDEAAFFALLQEAKQEFDWVFVDAPAGVGAGFRLAVTKADLAMVVTGADPAALRDGARTAEALFGISQAEAKIVVNRIRLRFFKKARFTVDDCMDTVGLPLLGIVPEDEAVALSAASGKPLRRNGKKSAFDASKHIAMRLLGKKVALMDI